MIIHAAGQQGVREERVQDTGNQAEQIVSAGKAILIVIKLHGIHVRIDQDGRFPVQAEGVNPFVSKFLHIVQIGEAGQRIAVEMILAEKMILFLEFAELLAGGGKILVSQERKLRSVVRVEPVADRVDIVITVRVAAAEKDVIPAAMRRELPCGLQNPAGVIRMHGFETAGVDQLYQLFTGNFHLVAESVRHKEGDNISSQILIDYKRNPHGFVKLTQIRRELIHKTNLLDEESLLHSFMYGCPYVTIIQDSERM